MLNPSPSLSPPVVAVDRLYKFLGGPALRTPVLQDISFELKPGEFLCIMGPSGSGKSTLLHLIAGLDEPSAGEVRLLGQSLSGLKPRARTRLRQRSIGYVFQFFNLLPNLTVAENVSLPLAIAGRKPTSKQEWIDGLLGRFGLEGRSGALPHELSGGQMQRVSIARALAGEQQLLLCDEPTGNLSQKAGQEIMEHLREVCSKDGKSVLLVTHNPRDAACADRVRFLVDGRLDGEHELRGPELSVERIHAALAELKI